MRRGFNSGERKAIARGDAYKCISCGKEGNSADHIMPYALGGPTELGNAQWLCGPCNSAKGAKVIEMPRRSAVMPKPAYIDTSVALRPWQREAVDLASEHYAEDKRNFFAAVAVGAGKTLFGLATYLENDFDLMIVVAPKTGIRGSWIDDAAKLGLRIDSVVSGPQFDPMRGDYMLPHGYALTASMLPSVTNDLRLLCARFKVLLIADEAHHYAEDENGVPMSTTKAIRDACGDAAFTIGLSGTPTRSDTKRISFGEYLIEGDAGSEGTEAVIAPDYEFTYEQCLAAGHVAPIYYEYVTGQVTQRTDDGNEVVYDFDHGDYSGINGGVPHEQMMKLRLRLSVIECRDWRLDMVNLAIARLDEFGDQWAGMIIAYTVEQARALADYLNGIGQKAMCLVADHDTERGVREFNSDPSYRWVVSITKISEGINIDRLRVAAYLSTVTTIVNFTQMRGRLARLLPDIRQADQMALMLIPADPRLIRLAEDSNKLILHNIPAFRDLMRRNGWTEDEIERVIRPVVSPRRTRGREGQYQLTGYAVVRGERAVRLTDEEWEARHAEAEARAARLPACIPENMRWMISDQLADLLCDFPDLPEPRADLKRLMRTAKDYVAAGTGQMLTANGVRHAMFFVAQDKYGREAIGEIEEYRPKPNGYWSNMPLEGLIADAMKYGSVAGWEKGNKGANKAAWQRGLLREIADACGYEYNPSTVKLGYWSNMPLEGLIADAMKYGSMAGWQRGNKGAYNAAHKRGQDDVIWAACREHWAAMAHRELTPEELEAQAKAKLKLEITPAKRARRKAARAAAWEKMKAEREAAAATASPQQD